MKDELLEASRKLVEKALSEGYDEAAALLNQRRTVMVKLANSEPSVVQRWRDLVLNLYLAKDKKILVISLSPKSLGDVEKTIKELLRVADKLYESPFYAPLPEPGEPAKLELVDKRLLDKIEDPSDIVERMVETAHREKIDYVAGMVELSYNEKALATSKDALFYEDSTSIQAYLRAFAGEDGSGQWSLGSRKLDARKIEEMASIAARYAVDSRNRVSIEPGIYDIILSPMVAGNLLRLVGMMASAFMMFMGMSMFMNKKPGDKVGSEKLTLIDDALNPELPGSTSFDDEGVATYSKPIIEKGIFKTMLHNSKTAAKTGMKSTGNAGWITPHPWNLVVAEGTYSLEELVGEVKKGILVTNNWYTRLQNYVEGVFSTITRDALFLIEDGKITRPVEKVRIADTLPRLLGNIDALGKTRYDIWWWEVGVPTRTPYILVRQLHTSKHTM